MEKEKCKRCLLLQSGEVDVFEVVKNYLETIDKADRASDAEYGSRLEKCKKCESLISGMCNECGCYVEIRAALKNKKCPNKMGNKW